MTKHIGCLLLVYILSLTFFKNGKIIKKNYMKKIYFKKKKCLREHNSYRYPHHIIYLQIDMWVYL